MEKTSQTQRLPFTAGSSFVGEVRRGAYLAGRRDEMPKDTRALTRAARDRAKTTGEPYSQARATLQAIRERMELTGESAEEAEAFLTGPANTILCETCGWTLAMVCPECPGCGCYNGSCSGWRHREYAHEDEALDRDDDDCPECGGSESLRGYATGGCIC